MSLSKIVISGKVIRTPEKRFTPNTNLAVTEFAVAVESLARMDAPAESTPVKIIAWRDLAERCAQEIRKGDLVAIDGRLQINNYTTAEGLRRRDVEIEAVSVENLSQISSAGIVSEADTNNTSLAPTANKSFQRPSAPAGANRPDDLEAIFASEDEIPF